MPSQSNSRFTSKINCEKEKFLSPISEPICKDNLFDDFDIEEGLLAPNPNAWINKDKKSVNKSLNYKTDRIENQKESHRRRTF